MSSSSARIPSPLDVRPLSRADLLRVMEIERASFSTPWRENTFEGLLERADTDLIAVTRDDRLIGYAVCWTVADQAELGNVAVAPEARGQGVGRLLVETALARVRRRGARDCFLEVRESNLRAQTLYHGCGFEVIGRRARYYAHPVEDALVMRSRTPGAGLR